MFSFFQDDDVFGEFAPLVMDEDDSNKETMATSIKPRPPSPPSFPLNNYLLKQGSSNIARPEPIKPPHKVIPNVTLTSTTLTFGDQGRSHNSSGSSSSIDSSILTIKSQYQMSPAKLASNFSNLSESMFSSNIRHPSPTGTPGSVASSLDDTSRSGSTAPSNSNMIRRGAKVTRVM